MPKTFQIKSFINQCIWCMNATGMCTNKGKELG